jgi:hypothetical protein
MAMLAFDSVQKYYLNRSCIVKKLKKKKKASESIVATNSKFRAFAMLVLSVVGN